MAGAQAEKQVVSRRSRLLRWFGDGAIAPEGILQALALTGVTPDGARWRRFLAQLLLILGVLALVCAVVLLIAYHWNTPGRSLQSSVVPALLAGALAVWWRLGTEKTAAAEEDWQVLLDHGIVTGSMPPTPVPGSRWYVRAMLGVTGWVTALLLLVFVAVGIAWIMRSELASALVGAAVIAAAWLMLFKRNRNDFVVQFALAVSFAGQSLFAVGIFGRFGLEQDSTAAWLLMTLAQVVLAAVMPNNTHRLWSAFAAAVAFYMLLHSVGLAFAAPAIILAVAAWAWLREFAWPVHRRTLQPMAYGLVVASVAMDMATGAFQPLAGIGVGLAKGGPAAPWAGELLLGTVLLVVVWALLRRWEINIPHRIANVALSAAVILVLVSFEAPGISAGVCIILLGYAHGNRILTGLGIAALLLCASSYYYGLDSTLLFKSQSLAVNGAVLLTLRWLLFRRIWRIQGEAMNR